MVPHQFVTSEGTDGLRGEEQKVQGRKRKHGS